MDTLPLQQLAAAPPTPPSTAAATSSPAAHAAPANSMSQIAQSLARAGLPAPPWQPDPAMQNTTLPQLALDSRAMATLSALAQLRATAQQALGLDLTDPSQAAAFAQFAQSAQQRMAELASNPANAQAVSGACGFAQAAKTLSDCKAVESAAAAGQIPAPSAPPAPAPPPEVRPFLRQLFPLLPLIAMASQLSLNLSADVGAQVAAAVRAMLRMQMPALSPQTQQAMQSLIGKLAAANQIRAQTGIDPVQAGPAAVQRLVDSEVQRATEALQDATGESPSQAASRLAAARSSYSPGLIATPDVVRMATSITPEALATLNWQVPDVSSLPAIGNAMTVAALASQLRQAGIAPTQAPCDACSLA